MFESPLPTAGRRAGGVGLARRRRGPSVHTLVMRSSPVPDRQRESLIVHGLLALFPLTAACRSLALSID
jgi:hypothetical protein